MEDTSLRIIELKQRITEELKKDSFDNDLIMSLSNELINQDANNVRFSVDAGIINRLGKELVGRHETAVSELVKNAYDADAQEVILTFEDAYQPGGNLSIEDNGVGMDRRQVINGFMRLSSTDKVHNPISSRYKRMRAGRKGIGRFATQRLGSKLSIITQTIDSQEAIKVTIDWNTFEPDKDLSTISNKIEEVPKIKEEGTILIIGDLREGWTDAMIKRVYRYTSDLLQPFPLSKNRKEEEKERVDPGFKSSYFRKEEESTYNIVDDSGAIYQHALAEIEGYIINGQGCWSLKSEKLNFPEEVFLIGKERDVEGSKFETLRDIHFKCYYFIFDPSLLPPQTLSFIRSVAGERGGIRLYRNGFRVLPYGEKGNDWIRLDESVRKNIILLPHANNNFFGFVEVTDKDGHLFEETSSREGLIENHSFIELTDFIYRSIVSAVTKIGELRFRKRTASQRDWIIESNPDKIVDTAIFEIEGLIHQIETEDRGEKSNFDFESEEFKEAFEKLKEGIERGKALKSKLIEETNMLRVLAGLGLVIGEFIHEVKRFLPSFSIETDFLKKISNNSPDVIARILRLETNIKAFTSYTSYFDRAIAQNVLRELESIELRDVIDAFREVVSSDLIRSGFMFHDPVFEDFDLFTIPMHKSEWASILFNLYTNSKKAIIRQSKKVDNLVGEVFIKCGRFDNNVYLEFSDNGDGIEEENKEKIFDAFFTTTSAAAFSSEMEEEVSGMGLGLKIVKDIIESYGGRIFVQIPPTGYSTTIRIEITSKK